ncbi:MAG: deoxyhypusine synthase family protein [Patescibacteria group bacterium]
MKPIKHIKIKKDMKVSELVDGMEGMGFGAGKIAEASRIMKKMFNDKECKIFFGVAGAMVPAGMKQVILDLLDDTDVFVTTGANLTHDLIEALGECHYQGNEFVDDKKLNSEGIDRIYNVFMKNSVYEKLEDFFEKNFDELKDCGNIKNFLWKIGEILERRNFNPAHPPENLSSLRLEDNRKLINKSEINCNQSKHNKSKDIYENQISNNPINQSILVKCYKQKIPIFCPGIADSGIGLMMWGRNATGKGKTNIDVFSDMNDIIDIAWTSKKNGVIYVGGGLPKNFIQQSLQFSKGADYGIQITTDRMEPGGSSGAPLREGISWGKMKEKADFVDVFCDATIALPLIYASVKR